MASFLSAYLKFPLVACVYLFYVKTLKNMKIKTFSPFFVSLRRLIASVPYLNDISHTVFQTGIMLFNTCHVICPPKNIVSYSSYFVLLFWMSCFSE